MAELTDELPVYLPPYLRSKERMQEMLKALRGFRRQRDTGEWIEEVQRNYYESRNEDIEWDQGDCWNGFEITHFDDAKRKVVTGLIVSNACDIALANDPPLDRPILFCPVVRLESLVARQLATGIEKDRLDRYVTRVKQQDVTHMFFLPAIGSIPDRVALMSNVSGHPIEKFKETTRARETRLSYFGHLLLMTKLAIHFCRIPETFGEPLDAKK